MAQHHSENNFKSGHPAYITAMIGCNNWTCFVVAFSIALAVYLSTIAPSNVGGDTGELLAEGCKLGTAHPPGYPAIIILFHFATKLGGAFGLKPALSANILCCILGATSAGLLSSSIYLLCVSSLGTGPSCGNSQTRTRKKRKKQQQQHSNSITNRGSGNPIVALSAIAAALMFAFSPIAWQYSVTAEVFALHSFFVSAIVHTTVRYAVLQTDRLTYLGAALCGAALTNQHTAILLDVPVAIWVVCKSNLLHGSRRSVLFKAALSFLVPIMIFYATVPYFAITRPHRGSWGDVTSIAGFVHHFLRRDYGTFQLYSGNDDGSESVMNRMLQWATDYFTTQSGNNPLVCFSFLLGCRHLMTIPTGRVVIASLAFYLGVFGTLANLPLSNPLFYAIHQRFWLHPNLLASVAVGVGLAKLETASYGRLCQRKIQLIVVVAMMASVLNSLRRGLRLNNESGNTHFGRYAHSVLEPLPQGSLLLLNYDQAWSSIRYLQECEGFRDDIISINTSMMSYPWFGSKRHLYNDLAFPGTHYSALGSPAFTMTELLDQNYHTLEGNIFIIGPLNYPDQEYRERYEEIPFGFARRIVLKEEEPGLESFRAESHGAWSIIAEQFASGDGLPDSTRYDESTWEYTISVMFWDAITQQATHLLELATREDDDSGLALISIVEASAWLEMAVANDDKAASSPNLRKNLGLGYMRIVQNKNLGSDCLLPALEDVFTEAAGNQQSFINLSEHWWSEKHGDCKGWASSRWESNWHEFLTMDGAKLLPDYGQVQAIYNLVVGQVAEKTKNNIA